MPIGISIIIPFLTRKTPHCSGSCFRRRPSPPPFSVTLLRDFMVSLSLFPFFSPKSTNQSRDCFCSCPCPYCERIHSPLFFFALRRVAVLLRQNLPSLGSTSRLSMSSSQALHAFGWILIGWVEHWGEGEWRRREQQRVGVRTRAARWGEREEDEDGRRKRA